MGTVAPTSVVPSASAEWQLPKPLRRKAICLYAPSDGHYDGCATGPKLAHQPYHTLPEISALLASVLHQVAPTISKRQSAAQSKVSRITSGTGGNGLRSSKRDKRIIKHANLMSRIQKSSQKALKRRRPSKKLVTNLESLASALPETPTNSEVRTAIGDGKIRNKSLKSRPGAMKRKEALLNVERERFNQNMAQMATLDVDPAKLSKSEATSQSNSGSSSRWQALRGFIQQTMEQRPEPKGT